MQIFTVSSKKRSGQMIFEFIVAAVVFIAIIFYIITYLTSSMGAASSEFYASSLQGKAVQVSEVLLKTPSGLAEEWPVLSSTRIDEMERRCLNDYQGLVRELGLFKEYAETVRYYNLKVKIDWINGTNILDCMGPGLMDVKAAQKGEVRRYALLNGDVVTVDVIVW